MSTPMASLVKIRCLRRQKGAAFIDFWLSRQAAPKRRRKRKVRKASDDDDDALLAMLETEAATGEVLFHDDFAALGQKLAMLMNLRTC